MIAFARVKKRRGDNTGRPTAINVPGAAASAASASMLVGVPQMSLTRWLFVPGEGWVAWREIHAQVERAYNDFRNRKALEGHLIIDREDVRQREITGGGAAVGVRRAWLRDWSARHSALCRSAEVENIFSRRHVMGA